MIIYPHLRRHSLSFLILLLSLNLFAQNVLDWSYGRNDYTFPFEEVPRHFIIHVPQKYTGEVAVPVVFMFHGTTGDGERYWKIGKWKELGEEENVITVFPSSWKYFITDVGHQQTKWNTAGLVHLVPEGTDLKDDVTFVNRILDALIETFKVDSNRIYASGFSNGAGFVHTRIMKEINHRFAAVATSGSTTQGLDSIIGRLVPLMNSIGTDDNKIAVRHPDSIFPFGIHAILSDSLLSLLLKTTVKNLNLSEDHTVDSFPKMIVFRYETPLGSNENEFHFGMIQGLGHSYPNGTNFDFVIAPRYWEFMQQFSLEETSTPTLFNELSEVSCRFRNPYRLGSPIEITGYPADLQNLTYRLVNPQGKLMLAGNVPLGQFLINKNLPAGNYYLIVESRNRVMGTWPMILVD